MVCPTFSNSLFYLVLWLTFVDLSPPLMVRLPHLWSRRLLADTLTSNVHIDWLKLSLSKPLTASQEHDHLAHDAKATIHTNTHHGDTREGCISDATSRLLKQAAAGCDWFIPRAFTGGRRPEFS